jgi:serine protease AprX
LRPIREPELLAMAKPPAKPRASTRRPGSRLEGTDPTKKPFEPEVLDRTVIAIPLLERIVAKDGPETIHDVIIDLNLDYPGGRDGARSRIRELVQELLAQETAQRNAQGIDELKSRYSQQYLFGSLRGRLIQELVRRDGAPTATPPPADAPARAVYKIWPDFEVTRLTNRTVSTIKADAARNAFGAYGEGIVWAVLDTGIDATHPHFARYRNLESGVRHRDFTASLGADEETSAREALVDEAGHGTHVAGIIAGAVMAPDPLRPNDEPGRLPIVASVRRRDEAGKVVSEELTDLASMTGMAPRCRLLSLKVLDRNGKGKASNLIAALEYVQDLNGYGRRLQVHGVNMSVGYDFDPDWFACGQSPLCVEVDRLVRTGVVAVVAAGNTGYGWAQTQFRGTVPAGMDLSINDPGNAQLAITVGSTHRDMPHTYGVSYFSSKGPTGDGRMKPDLVAPGEKVLSAASGGRPAEGAARPVQARYREDSGTSMAAPHVSGAVAAFLSIRREFIGQAEEVKRIFLAAATDLNRVPYFQGRGLVDLMRAIQSV